MSRIPSHYINTIFGYKSRTLKEYVIIYDSLFKYILLLLFIIKIDQMIILSNILTNFVVAEYHSNVIIIQSKLLNK